MEMKDEGRLSLERVGDVCSNFSERNMGVKRHEGIQRS